MGTDWCSVIRDADQYDVFSMARRIRDLATVPNKKLTIDDMAWHLHITNPGPFGTLLTAR